MEALEWALALSKAPAERIALRQRPLPSGILQLLQVAAGSSAESLAQVTSTSGEDPDHVQEAARFYVREVLFHQGADAYRVLGVEHDASTDTLRAHHRLLQQWLHPDRQTSDWDAIFAARVNAAWSQLRSDDRRAAYDLEHPPRRFNATLEQASTLPWQVAEEAFDGTDDPARWRRRMPAFALFAICAVLGLLAVRDMQREPVLELRVPEPEMTEPARANTMIHLPEALENQPALNDARAVRARERAQALARHPSTKTETKAVTTVSPVLAEATDKRIVRQVSEAAAPMAVQAPRAADVVRSAEVESRPAARAANIPVEVAGNTPPEPSQRARNAAPKAAESRRLVEAKRGMDQPAAVASPGVPVGRVQDAQQVGGRLISFMTTAKSATPPIWGSLTAQRGAAQLRDDFLDQGAPRVATPYWRVGEKVAAMQADIRYQDGRAGRLTADLVWREQRWLVTGMSIERDL